MFIPVSQTIFPEYTFTTYGHGCAGCGTCCQFPSRCPHCGKCRHCGGYIAGPMPCAPWPIYPRRIGEPYWLGSTSGNASWQDAGPGRVSGSNTVSCSH